MPSTPPTWHRRYPITPLSLSHCPPYIILPHASCGQFCFAKHVLPYQLKALGCELHPASLQLLEGLCTQVRYATRRVACGVLWCDLVLSLAAPCGPWENSGDGKRRGEKRRA